MSCHHDPSPPHHQGAPQSGDHGHVLLPLANARGTKGVPIAFGPFPPRHPQRLRMYQSRQLLRPTCSTLQAGRILPRSESRCSHRPRLSPTRTLAHLETNSEPPYCPHSRLLCPACARYAPPRGVQSECSRWGQCIASSQHHLSPWQWMPSAVGRKACEGPQT